MSRAAIVARTARDQGCSTVKRLSFAVSPVVVSRRSIPCSMPAPREAARAGPLLGVQLGEPVAIVIRRKRPQQHRSWVVSCHAAMLGGVSAAAYADRCVMVTDGDAT